MARIKWNNQITGEKAQFLADTLNEALFNYSFDSNKAPTLNVHFFCEDYLSTYSMVEEEIIQEGNLIPLNEEFEYIINKSLWLPNNISSSIFDFRNKQGFFKNISLEKNIETKKKSEYYKESANYIKQLLSSDGHYLICLLNEIKRIMNSHTFTLEEKNILYFLVREYISELISIGYNKNHLYNRVRKKLFSLRSVKNDVKYVDDFLVSLVSKEEKYLVVFGVSDDVYNEFKDLLNRLREATDEEKTKFDVNYVVETDIKAHDPVSALEKSKQSLMAFIDIYNACIHNSNMRIFDNGLVKKKQDSKFSYINDSLNLMTKNKAKPKEERKQWVKTAILRNVDGVIINAFDLHNNALQIKEPQTQFLTLWTIIEVLIETKQNQMSRSNYIANVMCSILCNSYFDKVLGALYQQIIQTRGIKTIINRESRGKNPLEKLAFILKDNDTLQQALILKLKDFPLEAYKIEHFANLFSSKEKMLSNLIRHSNRLRWQIMRIYRNRCMIVHNGSTFPYINSILENLHYYIDQMLEYILSKVSNGVLDLEAIYSCARINESENISILEDKKQQLTDEEYIKLIFNY